MNCIISPLFVSLTGNPGWGLRRKQKKYYEPITRSCNDDDLPTGQPWKNQYCYDPTRLQEIAEKFLSRNFESREDFLAWLRILYFGDKKHAPLADILLEAFAEYERNDNRPMLLRFKQEQHKLRRLNQKKLSEITISDEKLLERKRVSEPTSQILGRRKRDKTWSFIDYLYDYISQLKQTGKNIEIQTLDDLLNKPVSQKQNSTRPRGYSKKSPRGDEDVLYAALKEMITSNPELFAEIISLTTTGKYIETAIRFGYEDIHKINFSYLAKQLGKNRSTVQRGFYRALANIKNNPKVVELILSKKEDGVKMFAAQTLDDHMDLNQRLHEKYSEIRTYADFKKHTK
jgi:hypothetical protein